MPYVRIETNVQITDDKAQNVMRGLVAELSRLLSAPAAAVKVEAVRGVKMRMADEGDMAVHIEIRQCDYPKERSKELLDAFVKVVGETLGIPRKNVYIAVISNRNSMWKVLEEA